MEPKFASGLWVFGGASDRYNTTGYKPAVSVRRQIELAAQVPNLLAVETHQSDLAEMPAKEIAKLLADKGLLCSLVNTNVWGEARFRHGAFSHRDPKVRKEALDEGRKAVDMARALKCPGIGLWLGSDGFDYPFQSDYGVQWQLLIDGIHEIAQYAEPNVRVGIEYKPREPRNRMTISDVGKTLWLVGEIGLDNVGVAVDFGHSLMAMENPGESVALAASRKKLYNVHFNDAFRAWDDDMVVGTVHLWETLEFLYWCQQTQYDGYLGLDMFPYREDGVKAADMAFRNLRALWDMAAKIDVPALKKAQESMDALESQEVVRKVVFR
jgi:xylose isomerase